jgi:hypothetical protein
MGGDGSSGQMAQVEKAEAKKTARRLEKQIEPAASTDEVWKLITERAGEMVSIASAGDAGIERETFLSWGPDCEGEVTGFLPRMQRNY